jgi:NADP-dependent 3-hydroxy acid dehydrogenase YdfG
MNTNKQKTALVTGASRGMGRATALALGRANIRVFVHYGQSEAEASSAVQEIRVAGGQAEKVQADLETADGPIDLAKRVRELAQGGLDFLVANAGVSKGLPFDAYKIEDFDRLYAINVRAPFFLVQQALPFINEGGCIVLVSSVLARFAVSNAGQKDAPSMSACVHSESELRRDMHTAGIGGKARRRHERRDPDRAGIGRLNVTGTRQEQQRNWHKPLHQRDHGERAPAQRFFQTKSSKSDGSCHRGKPPRIGPALIAE